MRKILLAAFMSISAFAWSINGTGASFPYPVYKQWIKGFYETTQNRVNYTPT
jgi:phosphate transport system substrate-binding protein